MAFISRQLFHRTLSLSYRHPNMVSSSQHIASSLRLSKPSTVLATEQIRCQSSKPIYDFSTLDSGDQKIIKAREILGIKKLPTYLFRKSSIFLYEACVDKVDIERFLEHLKLEDTFSSWFCVTRLHVWMVLVRVMKEGKPNGETLRNEVISRMWEDTQARVEKLGMIKPKHRKDALKNYYHEFNATLLSLDEGLLTNDTILAGALWRNLFGMNADVTPQHLELAVAYVRAQLEHLHRNIRTDQLLFQGHINWKPFPPLMAP